MGNYGKTYLIYEGRITKGGTMKGNDKFHTNALNIFGLHLRIGSDDSPFILGSNLCLHSRGSGGLVY